MEQSEETTDAGQLLFSQLPGILSNNVYICKLCQSPFPTKDELQEHKEIHKREQYHHCHICESAFAKKYNLKRHLLTHSAKENGKHLCEICNKSFNNMTSLKEHKNLHDEVKPFVCGGCSRTFSGHSNLRKHRRRFPLKCGLAIYNDTSGNIENLNSKETIGTQPFLLAVEKEAGVPITNEIKNWANTKLQEILKITNLSKYYKKYSTEDLYCADCKEVYQAKGWYLRHLIDVHERDDILREYQLLCVINKNKQFLSKKSLQDNGSDWVPLLCFYCSRAFEKKALLIKHIKNHGINIENNFECSQCMMIFATPSDLHKHVKIEHKPQCRKKYEVKTKFQCSKCGKEFVRYRKLITHEMSDCGTIPVLKCNHCEAVYSRRESLTSHIFKHHFDPEKHAICEKCERPMKKKDSEKHIRHCRKKIYECEYCEKQFKHYSASVSHLSVHSGFRPYACGCGKRLTNSTGLRDHIKRSPLCKSYAYNGNKQDMYGNPMNDREFVKICREIMANKEIEESM